MSRSLVAPWVTPLSVIRAVSRWPVHSQLQARRNALTASTELASRTHERQHVEQYLAGHVRMWEARHGTPRPGVGAGRADATMATPLRAAL